MSDIKYIIVSDVEDEGEQRCCTRRSFPCLAVLRYAVAGVVTVLAIAVISMVIRAMLRSEDIRLFVNNGYIGADSLWISEITQVQHQDDAAVKVNPNLGAGAGPGHPKTTTEAAQIGVSKRDVPPESTTVTVTQINPSYSAATDVNLGTGDYGDAGAVQISKSRGCYLGCSGGSGSSTNFYNPPPAPPASTVTLQPPTVTNLRVILVINNPGGRSKIDCSKTTINISDAMPPHREIAGLVLSNFTVPEQTIITLQKRVKINDTAVLRYIWDRYGGRSTFGVIVQVSSSVVSYPLGTKTEPKTRTYKCSSVTLGLVQDEASFANQVDCTAENDKEWPAASPPAAAPKLAPASAPKLAPASAPAPA